jgi:ASC-1-like (ASCH) protein
MQVHLAILYKDYLDKILLGEKTIEGRFSKVKCNPHGRVFAGDKLFLKETSGPVVAVANVARVLSFTGMTADQAKGIIERYGGSLCLGQDFIPRVMTARYATLMYLEDVKRIEPIQLSKRDRRPWVILTPQTSFLSGENQWEKELWSALVVE